MGKWSLGWWVSGKWSVDRWFSGFNKTRDKNLFQSVAVEIVNVHFEMGKLFETDDKR